MPLYTYQCPDCKKIVDIIHGINDFNSHNCRECKGPMSKILSIFSFKGSSGFYNLEISYPKPNKDSK